MLSDHLAVEARRQNEEIAIWIEIFLSISMHDGKVFQQVPYEELSQRTFPFVIMLHPSAYLRHSYDEEEDWN